jgi:RNA methyltransferase, TrmH family
MIALRKLERLPTGVRLRKIAELLRTLEEEIRLARTIDSYYLTGLCGLISRSDADDLIISQAQELDLLLRQKGLSLSFEAPAETGRRVGTLAAALLTAAGLPPAEWDLRSPDGARLDPGARTVLPLDLYLEEIRAPFNVGSIFRSSEAFGVRRIYLSPGTPTPEQPRARRSAMGTTESVPWTVCGLEEARTRSAEGREDHTTVVLETGGIELSRFPYPAAALMILGNEEWGASEAALNAADLRLSIPMSGAKASLNVAVAAGIALQRFSEALIRA